MTAPARRALPAIYVVVDRNGPMSDPDEGNASAFGKRRDAVYIRDWNEKARPLFGPFSIVRYLPAPVPPRSRKGGRR